MQLRFFIIVIIVIVYNINKEDQITSMNLINESIDKVIIQNDAEKKNK